MLDKERAYTFADNSCLRASNCSLHLATSATRGTNVINVINATRDHPEIAGHSTIAEMKAGSVDPWPLPRLAQNTVALPRPKLPL